MAITTKRVVMYYTSDGKEFRNKKDAEQHESHITNDRKFTFLGVVNICETIKYNDTYMSCRTRSLKYSYKLWYEIIRYVYHTYLENTPFNEMELKEFYLTSVAPKIDWDCLEDVQNRYSYPYGGGYEHIYTIFDKTKIFYLSKYNNFNKK